MEDLMQLEEQGWQALSTGPEAARQFYRSILADEAVMLFPGGMRMSGKERILESMGGKPWSSYKIDGPEQYPLGSEGAALVYRVSAHREGQEPYEALVNSSYALRDARWRLVLHQQTPV
jgi:hypothetical protein